MALLDIPVVASADKMTDENFALHMKHRHSESLGYLGRVPVGNKFIIGMWRVFHSNLHRFRIDIPHEHGR